MANVKLEPEHRRVLISHYLDKRAEEFRVAQISRNATHINRMRVRFGTDEEDDMQIIASMQREMIRNKRINDDRRDILIDTANLVRANLKTLLFLINEHGFEINEGDLRMVLTENGFAEFGNSDPEVQMVMETGCSRLAREEVSAI